MDETYGEFQGTELDPSLDFDWDEEENDLVPILGLAAVVAAIVGGLLVLLGRRRQPTAAERAQDVLESATKEGRKGLKAATKAVEGAQLGDLLDEALARAGKVAKNGHLVDLLEEARKRAADIASQVDVGEVTSGARKGALAAAAVGGAGAASLLQDALERAKEASARIDVSDLGKQAGKARKRAIKAASEVQAPQIDTENAGKVLDDLKARLAEAIESVRNEMAPKAADVLKSEVLPAAQHRVEDVARRVREDVMPAAQDAVGRLREDVLPAAQERASHFADEYEVMPRARKAATATAAGAISLGGLLRTVGMAVLERVMQDVLPQASKMGKQAVTMAREDVIPAAAETAGEAAKKVRKDVLPRVGDAASHTPDMLADLLQMARERASEAIDKAQPVVAGAAGKGVHAAAGGVGVLASGLNRGGKGAGGAVTSARRGVTGAVGGAVDATTYVTRETTGILFWLSMLGGLILLVFMPEREKQEELWNNFRQFLGEVREMWRDLQGPEYDFEGETDTVTG